MRRIALDSSIFIYGFQSDNEFGEISANILNKLVSGEYNGVVSVLCLSEVIVKPMLSSKERGLKTQLLMEGIPHIDYIKVDEEIAIRSARLRAEYGSKLKLIDSLHLATAIEWKAEVFITNDHALAKLKIDGLKIVLLGEYEEFIG